MAREKRRERQYYYRKRRIGSRVISEYMGAGYLADLAHAIDEDTRYEAQKERKEWRAIVDAENATDALLDSLTEAVNAHVGALLLINGYHHGGNRQWRKKRKETKNTPI